MIKFNDTQQFVITAIYGNTGNFREEVRQIARQYRKGIAETTEMLLGKAADTLLERHNCTVDQDEDEGTPDCSRWVIQTPWTMFDCFATRTEAVDFGIRQIMRCA